MWSCGLRLLFLPGDCLGQFFLQFLDFSFFHGRPILRDNIISISFKASQITLALLWSLFLRKITDQILEGERVRADKIAIYVSIRIQAHNIHAYFV